MGMNLRYSPLEWDDVTKQFDFGGGTITNATIASLLSTSGTVYYVSSVATDRGQDLEGSQGLTPDKPLKSIDYAIGRCTANNGDVIACLPGHTENVTAAADIAFDKAGITLVGLGFGADRTNLTWTATASSIDITAASTRIFNIIGTAGIDSIVEAFNVQAQDCTIDMEWRDGSATVECITVFLCNASADNLKINLKYRGFIAGNACDSPISLNGSVGADIYVDFYGKAATAVVEFITAAVEDVSVSGNFYVSGTTDLSKNVVDTITGSTWDVKGFDGAAGATFEGGSGNAVAAGDLSAIQSAITVIDAYHDVPTADASTNAVMSDVVGNKTDAAVYAVGTTKTNQAYIKGMLNLLPNVAVTGSQDLTSGSVADLFTIAGGPVLVEALIGFVDTACSANACAAKLIADPTNGADTDMCATFDLNACAQYSYLTIDGTIANAMVNAVPGTALPLGIGMDIPLILPIGTVDLNLANTNLTTGAVTWYMRYRPLAAGATVTGAA